MPRPHSVTLAQIRDCVGGELHGASGTEVSGVSSLDLAGEGDLAYAASDRFEKAALASRAGAFVVGRLIETLRKPQLVVANPAYSFAVIAQRFFTAPYEPRGIAAAITRGHEVIIGPDVSIWPFVTLGDRSRIGARVTLYPGVFIGADCAVGDDCVLYPNVVVRESCRIGDRVIIHSGTVIGSDGFGYVQQEGRHHKIPQLGSVTIEDDVELGANVTVDRATFGHTVIKRGTKIDNLVQVAHNVTVGEDSILVAQVGIAGSTTLGHHVIVGGQAGLSDHIRIGDQVMIAARSGVARDLESKQIVAGSPAMPHTDWLRLQPLLTHLPEFRQQLRQLEKRLQLLEGSSKATPKKQERTR